MSLQEFEERLAEAKKQVEPDANIEVCIESDGLGNWFDVDSITVVDGNISIII